MKQEQNQLKDVGSPEAQSAASTQPHESRARTLKRTGAYIAVLGVAIAVVYWIVSWLLGLLGIAV